MGDKPDPGQDPPSAGDSSKRAARLAELADLHRAGVLSTEEFLAATRRVVAEKAGTQVPESHVPPPPAAR